MESTHTLRPVFTWLAVGLVMTVVDLRINGFDLIPDFIGYLIATLTLMRLRELDPSFGWAAAVTGVLTPVSLLSLDRPPGTYSKTGSWGTDLAWYAADTIVGWLICSGILSAARRRGDLPLAATAANRRVLVVLSGLAIGLPFLLRNSSPGAVVAILIVVAIFVIVVFCLLIGLLRQAGRSLTLPEPHGAAFFG